MKRPSEYYLRRELYELVHQDPRIFEFLQAGSLDGIWYWDLENPKEEWLSPRFKELFGYEDHEIPNSSQWWQENIFPEDLQVAIANFDKHCADTSYPFDQVVRYRHKDGSTIWVRCRGIAIRDESGKAIRMLGAHTDVTALKQAEEALRDSEALYHSLVDSLPACVLRKDLQGHFTFANRAYCEFVGRTKDEIIGKTDYDLTLPELADKFRRDDLAVVDTGQPLREIEVDARKARWVEVIKTPVRDAEGRIRGTQAIFWDVTERQLAVHALQEAKESAEAASKAKSEFLANMSHEIRTPLNAVVGMTELLLDTPLSVTQREYLDMVRVSGESLMSLINDILDFSKIEAGKLDLERMEFDLRDDIGDTMKALALRAGDKGLEIACHVAPEVPLKLGGDPNRLRQIIVNLVGNAIKFTEKGEVVLDVQVMSRVENAATLHFAVSDTGIGIDERKLVRVFEAFEQADSGSTRQFGGTGLGLAISSRLVELMGGRLWATSELGRGSTFHFTAQFECAATPAEPSQLSSEPLRDVRVLIVDDNQTSRSILTETLENWGMRPKAMASAEQAVCELSSARETGAGYALVLADADMPQCDGFQLTKRIKADQQLEIEVILMIASGDGPREVSRSQQVGAAAYLTKPVKQSELLNLIAKCLCGQESKPASRAEAAGDATHPLRILLVEDSYVNQRLAVGLLSQWGHQIHVAKDGRDALAAVRESSFDLVLMDVQMPHMDGYQATAAIRELEAASGGHLPIVAMTAHAMKGDREACLAAGMDDYIAKPIRKKEVRRVLERVCARGPIEDAGQATANEVLDPEALQEIDWNRVLQAVDGNHELLKQVADTMLDESRELLEQLERAVDQSEAKNLQRSAHTLKGILYLFGKSELAEFAERLERIGKSGSCEGAAELLPQLQREMTIVQDQVRHYLRNR